MAQRRELPARPPRPTLAAVAAGADVSLATASRALAGNYPVAAPTKARVLQMADELGYAPPHPPSAKRRYSTIGVLTRDIRQEFLGHVLAGIEEVTADSDHYCLMVSTRQSPQRELDALGKLVDDPNIEAVIVAGGVMTGGHYPAEMRRMVERYGSQGTPLVFCGRPDVTGSSSVAVADYDRRGGAASATSYLLSQGHRRIACVRGPLGFSTSDERFDGYHLAMAAFGVPVDPALIRVGDRLRSGGYLATADLLREHPDITAIFAECDAIASGCLAAARETGRRLPDDLSLVGFDDLPVAQEMWPDLTTVHLPFDQLGRAAARLALEPPEPGSGRERVLLGTHLVVRGSVAPVWGD